MSDPMSLEFTPQYLDTSSFLSVSVLLGQTCVWSQPLKDYALKLATMFPANLQDFIFQDFVFIFGRVVHFFHACVV